VLYERNADVYTENMNASFICMVSVNIHVREREREKEERERVLCAWKTETQSLSLSLSLPPSLPLRTIFASGEEPVDSALTRKSSQFMEDPRQYDQCMHAIETVHYL
jgi:hypothetical protein